MTVLMWILQVIVFLVIWKVVHLLFWNLRKGSGASSLLWSMLMTLVIAILGVIVAHMAHSSWVIVVGGSIILGIANGEYEYNRQLTR
ncbi:MAG: hypothetical protein OWR52_07965 [Acidibacillus sp.]|uniref:Uncharacterized protein n=1 Tax=Sulfoacidibacillus ferrooxidans TaxID=2005001 RepID=A0A9X2ABV3_9BACL|nr:hypothetical protein [Sulfoacidibacillus ferrooxidans]MCI0183488.1 hypothetical protein [Sulfoacidibacillus ferrooxidans]MCY0893425.1 hypothetical protein [Acidibacillus sp.]